MSTLLDEKAAPTSAEHELDKASDDDVQDEIPLANASFFSILFFTWLTPMLVKGWKKKLEAGDLWKMDKSREALFLAPRLEKAWKARVSAAIEANSQLIEKHPSKLRQAWWRLLSHKSSKALAERTKAWHEDRIKRPSLVWTLNDVFGKQFWLAGLFKVTGDCAQLMGPLVSKSIIRFAQEHYAARSANRPGPNIGRGVGAAIGLFLLTVSASICQHQWFWRSMSTGVLARASLINSLYKRGLGLTPRSRLVHSNGALINHLSTDISRVDYLSQWFHPVWCAPIQVIVCLIILCAQLGPSALAGFSLFLLLTPIQERAMSYQLGLRRGSMKFTDQRAGLLQELLGAMRIIKYFTYEMPFLARINRIRRGELKGIRSLLLLRSATQAIAFSIPVLAAVLSFVTYALSGHSLDPAIIFTSLSLFSLLRQPLMFLPRALSSITDGRNALGRLARVMEAETLGETVDIDGARHHAISVQDADFYWEESAAAEPPLVTKGKARASSKLQDKPNTSTPPPPLARQDAPFSMLGINLEVPHGQLIAIVGSVGSGKSSLIQGLIGEMRRTRGKVLLSGRVAYCAQTPWIQNATLRNNVIFGGEWDEDRYWKAISDSSLMADLAVLPDGDLTEIGEKGINLSGGQKARVNIARALYNDAEIVCLDDPLSAVDAHVGERLFHDAILGALRGQGKTVILVTHALQFLAHVDRVIHLVDGHIHEDGRYQDLVQSSGVFSELIRDFGSTQSKETQNPNTEPTVEDITAPSSKEIASLSRKTAEGTGKETGFLIKAEQRKTGAISKKVYLSYISAGRGAITLPLILLSGILMQAAQILNSYWLVWWQDNHFNEKEGFYMGIYAGLGVAQACFTFALGAILSWMSYLASEKMHSDSIKTVFHAPASFFDTTPLGRILSVFGKDIDTIDNTLADALRMLALTLSSLLGAVTIISILFYYFLPIVCVIGIGYIALAKFYNASAREMKRIDAILRSHLYSHFSESLSGLATIRAYNETPRFIRENGRLIDQENRALFLTITNQRWLSIRLDSLGGLLTFVVAIMAIVGVNGVSPAQIGLVLTYMVNITQILGVVTRQTAEVENNMNGVERVYQFSSEGSIPQEPAYENKEMDRAYLDWPKSGSMDFRNVFMSYRPGLPPVLKGISFSVSSGQKIGIVGRTGAGKSSLLGALFRLVELSSGTIEIDGVDISTMGLRMLRSKLSIIPQEPLLFSGTIRTNLDPFAEHEDADLYDALRRAHLIETKHEDKSTVKPAKQTRSFDLDSIVEAEGSNMSLGERSLLSLARALCNKARIVVLDEATVSVDMQTDSKIQETILNEFHEMTLLCIAHRLRTVIVYDKILVLDDGGIAEFDTPANLYRSGGIFRGLCERSDISLEDIERQTRPPRV